MDGKTTLFMICEASHDTVLMKYCAIIYKIFLYVLVTMRHSSTSSSLPVKIVSIPIQLSTDDDEERRLDRSSTSSNESENSVELGEHSRYSNNYKY